MAVVEVDEHQLGSLQNTAKIVQTLLGNPKTRNKVLAAYKEAVPTANVPEIESQSYVDQKVNGIEKAVMDFIAESREDRAKREVEDNVKQLRAAVEGGRKMLKDRGYTEDGIKAIEEFRDTKGLVDYNDAVKLWEIDNPPPQVNDPSTARMSMFDVVRNENSDNEFQKRLFESQGEGTAAEQQAYNIIRDMRGGAPRR